MHTFKNLEDLEKILKKQQATLFTIYAKKIENIKFEIF